MNPSSSATYSRPIMTRRRAMLEGKGNPGEGPFLVDPNAPREPRDIVIEEEVMAKIEVKEEPDEEGGLEAQVETHQENEPGRKRVKVEDGDVGEMVVVEDELDIPLDSLNVNEDQEEEMEQVTDDGVPPEVDDAMAHDVNESTPSEVGSAVPPAPKVDDALPSSESDFEAFILQQEKFIKELSELSGRSLEEIMSFRYDGDFDDMTLSSDTSEDEDPIAFTSSSCQAGSDGGDHNMTQTKILELFPEVIKVYWEKYARFQPNSRNLLNLGCRRVCKTWKDGMDKVLEGEYTPLKNIHPTVIIPNGDLDKTGEIVQKVLEAYKNVDLTICPFPPRVLEIKDQNTDSTVQQVKLSRNVILTFIKKFGSGVKEFKYYGIIGEELFYQYASLPDWYFTVVGDWIARMPNLEKLTMRNSWDKGVRRLIVMIGVKLLSDKLNLYPIKFPLLKNLKSLEEDLMPYCIITTALIVNTHVSYVHSYSDCIKGYLERLNFPALRSMSYADVDFIFTPGRKSIFKSVEKLELDNSSPSSIYMDLDRAFRFVQNFNGEKLKSLHFKFPELISEPFLEEKIDKLVMPQLKELSITFFYDDEQRPFTGIKWTEDNIVEMCSVLNSLEKLKIFKYRIDEIDWKENVRELKMCQINKLLKTRLVNRLMRMLSNLRMVEIQPAFRKEEGVTIMKSLYFIREASKE